MLRKWLCQADATVQLHPVDPLLVKSGYATLDGPDMVPVSTLRNGEPAYFLPGSSLKGVLRSHFERIARTLQPGSVCLPYYRPTSEYKVPVAEEAENYGCGFRSPPEGNSETTATIYQKSCAACRLFGSLRFAGRFSIGDAYPVPGHEPQRGQRNGVGIDRFTGGTVRGVLFDLTALEGGIYETQIRVVNFELWQLAAVNFLLHDLADQMIAVGSGRSRGLGRVRGAVTRYELSYIRAQTHVVGLGELASPEEREAYGFFTPEVPCDVGLAKGQRFGLRHKYDLSDNWSSLVEPLGDQLEPFLQTHKPLRPTRK